MLHAYKARENELTAVLNREGFDEFPGVPRNEHELARWTQYRADYNQAAKLELIAPFPLQIDFELNSTCQLKCGFCMHGHTRVKRKEIAYEDFCRVIDEGEQYGLISIKLNYINEPLLLRDLHKYIRYARDHGVLNIYFATNGLLLDREQGQQLIDAGVSKIMISLDAATPETYKIMRSSNEYERVVSNIREFIALRNSQGLRFPLVRVNFVQTKLNIHELDDFVKQWTGVADMFGFQRQVQLPDQEDDLLPSTEVSDSTNFRCSFPFKLMVVDANGDILPCCTFSGRPMAVGNINSMTIKQAWDDPSTQELRQTHLDYGYQKIEMCRHCIGGG